MGDRRRWTGRQRPDERIDRTDVRRNPSNAICRCIAEGEDGDRVGVFGSSENNTGVFARSHNAVGLFARGGQGESAAEFDGPVKVSGSLTVEGWNLLSQIRQLRQRVEALEDLQERVAAIEDELPTLRGEEPTPTPSRPTISGYFVGSGRFHISGSGFQSGTIQIHLYTPTYGSRVDSVNSSDGTITNTPVNLPCSPGEQVRFFATDGRGIESNKLWIRCSQQ